MCVYCRWHVLMSMNTWNTKWTLPFYITISKKVVFLIMINYCILFSLTYLTILIAYCVSFVDGWFWWPQASGIQKSVHRYKTNSSGGVFPIMNNYWLWNMFNITNCVYILTLFNPFFSLSAKDNTLVHITTTQKSLKTNPN